jgi:hypothetical protein
MNKLASNKDLWASLSGLSAQSRSRLLRLRNVYPTAGTERALFRRQIPHNPLRILDVAREIAEIDGWENVSYGVDSEGAWIRDGENSVDMTKGRCIFHLKREDIDVNEAEFIACLLVLQEISAVDAP